MSAAVNDVATLMSEGRLADAVAAETARVRAAPDAAAARGTLAELLCLSGAFDRAETQLATLAQQTVDRPVAIARMRHLVRAAMAREAWFRDAAVPALMGDPSPAQRAALTLALAVRDGDPAATAAALDTAETTRPHVTGNADGVAFDDLRDADDASAWFFEILTHDGNYIWADLATIETITFTPPRRPIDLLWREARLALHDGRVADIVVPAQYVDAGASERHRVALETSWRDGPGNTAFGVGQRVLLLGDEAKPILEVTKISFDRPATSAGTP